MADPMASTASIERFRKARERYRPQTIRLLFIAEAPPAFQANRLFYYEQLTAADTLFLELMKTLYPSEVGFDGDSFASGHSARLIRLQKPRLLQRFQHDGYFLIDASEQPMPDDASAATKASLMRQALPALLATVRQLLPTPATPVLLIGKITYEVCADSLCESGFNVMQNSMINHPARGGQVQFRAKLSSALERLSPLPSEKIR